MWWMRNKWKVIVLILLIAALAAAFYFGGNAPGSRGWSVSTTSVPEPSGEVLGAVTATPTTKPAKILEPELRGELEAASGHPANPEVAASSAESDDTEKSAEADEPAEPFDPEPTAEPTSASAGEAPEEYEWQSGMLIDTETGKDQYLTDPVPEGMPLPVEPQDVTISNVAYNCTLSICCAAILGNMDLLDPEKNELVPADGWILESTTITFYEGESVFNVLQRTCKQQGVHMEFVNTPIYNSAYIEGIGNLYEFDVGELSGWMYKVNDWFPNYGCSRYQLKDGDVIEWIYTCDLGGDVGGGYSTDGQK